MGFIARRFPYHTTHKIMDKWLSLYVYRKADTSHPEADDRRKCVTLSNASDVVGLHGLMGWDVGSQKEVPLMLNITSKDT